MKKIFLLLIFLVLPSFVFLLLKFAGDNQYEVPVLHQDDIINFPVECQNSQVYNKPYSLSERYLSELNIVKDANVVIFPDNKLNSFDVVNEIKGEFDLDNLGVVECQQLTTDYDLISEWKKCVLFVESSLQSVLVDGQGRIRGYYDLKTRVDIDRLRVEIKIVLNKY